MLVTERTKQVLAYRRQRRELLAAGYEEVGERGGMLWQIYRGGRVGQRIRDVVIAEGGLSVYVLIS